MNLEQLRRLAILIIGEKREGITLSPVQFCDALHLASLKQFKRKLGLPEEYRPGMPLPAQAYEITKRITEDLRVFKVIRGWDFSNPIQVDKTGKANYPDDYYIVSTVSHFYVDSDNTMERNVDVLSDLEYQERNTSLNEKPDMLFPICNMQADFFRVSPKDITQVNMVYLRLPKKPVYAIFESKGYYEYDNINSVQLEWDEMNQIDIMAIMLYDMGIKLEKADVLNYANQIKERGI